MCNRTDNNLNTYYEVMSFQMNSNFETNSCLSLNNLTSSNELSPLPVGQNSTNNEEGIYNVDLTPNIFTTNTSSLYSSSNNDDTSYYFVDITQCIWPRPATQLTNCNYPLPSFNLLDSYNIHVGKKFTTNPVFIPFVHCQNALFIISAGIANANNTISWLVIDQSNKSITFDLSQINSVGVFNISMSAKMITYFKNSNDTSKYTTINYFSNFVFSNDNCFFISSNASYYLVVDKLSTFMLTFNDTEQDLITMTIQQNSFVNTFVRTTSNTNQFVIMLQTNQTSNDPTNLVISFTDSYHKNASFMQNITIKLYLFAVDPPYFANDLQLVHANRCSNTNVDLPAVIDPNGLNCTISLDPSTPAWVSLSNRSLTLNTTDFNYNISETTIVLLKITNEKNAWVKYNLTIEIASYTSLSFGVISNITVVEGTQTEVKLDLQNALNFQIVDCTNNTITWIEFDKQSSTLIINSSNNFVQTQCAKLLSNDSCQNKVYSNEFTIFVNQTTVHPPILANSFGPLKIYSGQTSLFIIPEDLFISVVAYNLEYSVEVLNCSVSTVLHANITSSKLDNSSVLYLQSNDPKTCFIALIATDLNSQSAETIVEVDALNCASKDCAQCKSEYQADCVKCTTNYVLGSAGVCLWNTVYFSDSLDNLFDICGLVIMICLTINCVLIVFIEIRSLCSIEFAYTIIILVVSSSKQNTNLMRLITWMQIFKFDFGFIDYFNIRQMLFCKLGTDKMAELQFYCQSTVLNYFMLLVIILAFLCIVFALKFASRRLNFVSKWYKFIISKLKTQSIAWISIHIFWPFLWINLISDALNSSSHLRLSLLSFLLFVVCVIILMIKLPSVFTLLFVKSIGHNDSAFFTLLTMFKSICHALLFTFESHSVQVVVLLVELTLHFPFITTNLMMNKEKSLFDLYSTKMCGVKHSFLLAILIVISIDSIVMVQVSNSQAVALMIVIFFIFCTAVDLGSVIILHAKLRNRSAIKEESSKVL